MNINAKNAFQALEDMQLKNRVKQLETDNADRVKLLASRTPEWPKGYRPTRRPWQEKKKHEQRH